MLSETRKLISNSAIYGIGNVLTKAVAFFLIPLYARKLQPSEYGVVGLLELVEAFGKAFLVFGLGQAILRFVPEYRRRGAEHSLISSFLIFILLANAIVLGLLFAFPEPFVSRLLSLSPENLTYFRYILIVLFASSLQRIFLVVLQSEDRAFWYAFYTFSSFLLLVLLNIYKVGIKDQGVLGIVQSKLYVALLGFVVVSAYFVRKLHFQFSYAVLKEGLKYGFPLVFVVASLTTLTVADRYFLKIFRDMSEVGIYSMTYKFGMILNMVLITPFQTAFMPFIFRQTHRTEVKFMFRKYLTYFLFVGFICFLALSIFAREIQLVVTTRKYLAGYTLIPLITFSYLLFGIRNFFSTALGIAKKTHLIALASIGGALVNIVLNILMIPRYGMFGAALATLFSYFFIALTSYLATQYWYPIRWDWKRGLKLLTTALLIYSLTLGLDFQSVWLRIFMKGVLWFSYPFVLSLLRFYTNEERRILANAFAKIRARPG